MLIARQLRTVGKRHILTLTSHMTCLLLVHAHRTSAENSREASYTNTNKSHDMSAIIVPRQLDPIYPLLLSQHQTPHATRSHIASCRENSQIQPTEENVA